MDSALLWALIQDRLYSGAPAAEAVASVVREVAAAAPGSRLNLLLTDGEQIVATTWTHALWFRRTADSVAVSSEPWQTEGWEEVPDQSLLVATKNSLAITPLAPRPAESPMEGRE
jgi:glutamine amidotransferase